MYNIIFFSSIFISVAFTFTALEEAFRHISARLSHLIWPKMQHQSKKEAAKEEEDDNNAESILYENVIKLRAKTCQL